MKAKYFAVLVGGLEVVALLLMPRAPIARFAHLGGLLIGYLYIKRERWIHLIKRKSHSLQSRMAEAQAKREGARRSEIRREMDRILDKINSEGMGSLTDRERRFLRNQSGGAGGVS